MSFPRRSDYQASRITHGRTTAEDTEDILDLGIYRAPAGSSVPSSFASYELDESFDYFITEQRGMIDNEAHQVLIKGDGESIIFFDRLLPLVSLMGFVYDHANDIIGADGALIPANGHSKWRSFYERARVSQIAGTSKIVRASIAGVIYYGALVSSSASGSAQDPHRVLISTSLMVMASEPLRDAGIQKIADPNVYGFLSDESAQALGVRTPAAVAQDSSESTTVGSTAVRGSIFGSVAGPFTGPLREL